jgi:hypothetical protein
MCGIVGLFLNDPQIENRLAALPEFVLGDFL